MNIVLIAPPAAGKGTQSQKICETYKIPHISTGDLLRKTEDKKIKKQLKQGQLVDDKVITKLLKDRIAKEDCQKGFVLDGYPRNINQAKQLDEITNNLIIIILELPKEIAKKRIIGRLLCPNCGNVYNELIHDSMPKEKGICDHCHTKLIKREDDNEKAYNNRYKIYQKETEPIIEYYKETRKINHINSGINAQVTFNQIQKILGDVIND